MRSSRSRHPRGSSLIWTTVVLIVLVGFCSLAVDFGRVQVVKTELRRTADAAARYAEGAMGDGIAAVRARAKDVADDNTADGTPVILEDSDIQVGRWDPDTRTFVVNGTPADSVRITARRAGANAVPLMLARVLGRNSVDVSASAVMKAGQSGGGFTGLNGIHFKNKTFVGSYDSSSVAKPTKGHSTGKAVLASNGAIDAQNHVELDGDVTIGPSGSVTGVEIDGTTKKKSTPITAPATPPAGTGSNPLGLPSNYTVNVPTILPAGTYRFTALTVNADLGFSGVAVVYVDGNIAVDNSTAITAYQSRPDNLKIYQTGTGRTFIAENDFEITANVLAPGSDFVTKNKLFFYGSAVFRTIEAKNNTEIFGDERIAGTTSGGLVQ